MSVTLKVELEGGGVLSVTVPDFEFGDVDQFVRRQQAAETDGGQVFSQDLQVEDQFIDAGWNMLDSKARSDLMQFLRAAVYRQRKVTLEIGGGAFAVPLSTGQVIAGQPIGTGFVPRSCDPALGTHATVQPDTAVINGARIEQSEAAFEQIRNARASVTLRFRVEGGPISAGG